jgi:hypothetical protein
MYAKYLIQEFLLEQAQINLGKCDPDLFQEGIRLESRFGYKIRL